MISWAKVARTRASISDSSSSREQPIQTWKMAEVSGVSGVTDTPAKRMPEEDGSATSRRSICRARSASSSLTRKIVRTAGVYHPM